ncbi:MAG: SUMF1/EgtB/PvdO family nonheme iron enzyme [Polyangiaceae bacterium]|nr:SUMF1/EgtB/PvdO family nonheme iron enzyme [Polyangiaceae bacterium]
MNQGNPALARRAVEGAACRRGLEGLSLQTPEQRTLCGADNMVPIYRGGRKNEARACVDLFEFPNVACELPLVWASPTQARGMCEAAGKRLCTQDEWVLACGGDPAGGPDQRYAYGDALDLTACNTNKPAAAFGGPPCDPTTAADAWRTCRTNAEPAGAFPRCRSRFGVFDLHGNVAEIMTRRDDEGHLVSQLKGSAFFYVDVARRHDEKLPPKRARETYPDHCAHDPRWHVEPMNNAWHVNYHLGFRCCKTVARAESLDARPHAAPKTRRASRGTRAGGVRAHLAALALRPGRVAFFEHFEHVTDAQAPFPLGNGVHPEAYLLPPASEGSERAQRLGRRLARRGVDRDDPAATTKLRQMPLEAAQPHAAPAIFGEGRSTFDDQVGTKAQHRHRRSQARVQIG